MKKLGAKGLPKKGLYFSPFDVKLDNVNVYQPDLIFVTDLTKVKENFLDGAPDFVVEILSPLTRVVDMIVKKEAYENAGVKEYWVIDPEKQEVIIFLSQENKKFDSGTVYLKRAKITSKVLNLDINVRDFFP